MMDTIRKGPPVSSRLLPWLVATGVVVFALGLFAAPERIWPAWLVSVSMLIGLALAGPVFIAMVRLCSGRWADPVLPVARAMGAVLPLGVLLAVFVVFGAPTLYEWSHADPDHASPLLAAKLEWLNLGGFIARAALCFGLWHVVSRWMQRRDGRGRAGVYLIVFAFTLSIFTFDWIMSLEVEWFSSMFALYNFAGLFLSGLAAMTWIALGLEQAGRIPPLSRSVRHDLGKLLFAFSFFWGYIWFCQYMLIWYTNMPEETTWFSTRLSGSWTTMTLLSLATNFLVPFLVLLPAAAKASRTVLVRVAALLIVGRWLDLYVMITPSASAAMPPLGPWEVAPPVAVVAAFFMWTHWRFAAAARPAVVGPAPLSDLA